jgi:hypothetical protein
VNVRRRTALALVALLAVTLPVAADSTLTRAVDNAGPVFGFTTGPGQQLVADAGQGISGFVIWRPSSSRRYPGVSSGHDRPEPTDQLHLKQQKRGQNDDKPKQHPAQLPEQEFGRRAGPALDASTTHGKPSLQHT